MLAMDFTIYATSFAGMQLPVAEKYGYCRPVQSKKDIRNQMLQLRNAMAEEVKANADAVICEKLIAIAEQLKPQVVHTYLPMGSEVDVWPVIHYLHAKGVTIVAPKALRNRQTEHWVLTDVNALEEGIYGTKHPANSKLHEGDIDMFIIPGLAFDKNNYRLGYGAGYYDQFLKDHLNAYKLAVCYPFQLLDEVPVEPHDVRLDEVLS
jgi:5-formyltetrahydrofolate cyclo-ligase